MVKPLFLLPAVLIVGFAASAAAYQEDSTQGGSGTASAHVKDIYKIDCAICHGENGDGKTDMATSMKLTMADFTDPKALEGKSEKDLFDLIRKGKDQMPPEDASRAKDADIRGLIQYVRSLSKGHNTPAAEPGGGPVAAEKPAEPGR